jgi:type IX secretion system PorP/SprF family membrane protein
LELPSGSSIKKNNMKKVIFLFALIVVAGVAKLRAQQDPQFSHYMYNTVSVNPAYAGSRGVLNITGLHRSQWIGLDGAPTSQTLSLNTPLRNKKMGIGFSVVNDRIGPLNQTFIYADYSYAVRLTEKLKLSFGLKAGVNWFQPKIAGLATVHATKRRPPRVDVAVDVLPCACWTYVSDHHMGLGTWGWGPPSCDLGDRWQPAATLP